MPAGAFMASAVCMHELTTVQPMLIMLGPLRT